MLNKRLMLSSRTLFDIGFMRHDDDKDGNEVYRLEMFQCSLAVTRERNSTKCTFMGSTCHEVGELLGLVWSHAFLAGVQEGKDGIADMAKPVIDNFMNDINKAIRGVLPSCAVVKDKKEKVHSAVSQAMAAARSLEELHCQRILALANQGNVLAATEFLAKITAEIEEFKKTNAL